MQKIREQDIARLYHINSNNVKDRISDFSVNMDRKPMRFRTYLNSKRVGLPGRDFRLDVSLGDVLQRRRSVREFHLRPLELDVLGRLLHTCYGVRGHRQVEEQWVYDRPSPSAGGLYPLELYVAAQAVGGLTDGIYHYDARAHELEIRQTGIYHKEIADMTIGQQMVCDANLVVIISAVFQRTMWKYGQRGYRYVWLDAGHLGQNLYLVAVALGLGPVAIGGFFDNDLNRLLALPAGEEVVYLVCVGQLKTSDARRVPPSTD